MRQGSLRQGSHQTAISWPMFGDKTIGEDLATMAMHWSPAVRWLKKCTWCACKIRACLMTDNEIWRLFAAIPSAKFDKFTQNLFQFSPNFSMFIESYLNGRYLNGWECSKFRRLFGEPAIFLVPKKLKLANGWVIFAEHFATIRGLFDEQLVTFLLNFRWIFT